MDSTFCKEGFLNKAGKRSFQAWRKRWFVMNGMDLKYYNPGSQYDETNLLGTIQMMTIQSVAPSKGTKHGFDIITRNRTYNVSAKTDNERDDWILTLRKASANKRISTNSVSSHLYSEIPNSSTSQDYPVSAGKSKKSKRKKTAELCSEPADYVSCEDEKVYTDGRIPSGIYEEPSDLNVPHPAAEVQLKSRTVSESNVLEAEMPSDDLGYSVEESIDGIYNDLNEELDNCTSDEDYKEIEIVSKTEFVLPESKLGASHAFDEIRKLLETDLNKNVDLKTISKKYKLHVNENEEFPGSVLLKLYLERNK